MGLVKRSRIKRRRDRVLETKGELDIEGLQQWQKDILAMENTPTMWLSICDEMRDNKEIPLTQSQANMLEKVLGDEFFIQDEKVRDILEAVWECGFYYERDRKVLNLARDCYLKGRNWIKKNG